jgi:hypothetical protein
MFTFIFDNFHKEHLVQEEQCVVHFKNSPVTFYFNIRSASEIL